MKNLKKVLAMVLAFACTFSMFAGAKVFEDVKAGSDYSEAVTMLSDLGIIQGKDDGKYHPEDTITRAEACAMIARLMTGDPNVSQYVGAQSFTDVAKGSWKDSAIGYCYINGIVIGVGNNKFEPDRAITDAEFITMVVRAMGYETADMKQNYPFSYMSNAQAIGLLDGTNMVASTDALRGEDAQVIYNALFADYARGAKLVNTTHGTSVETYPTLAESVWGLTRAAAGTWKEKDDETATLEYCKAHTWVVLGADTANEGHILAYPISDSDGDLYAMGKGVEAVSFKYDGDASAVAGYQVELWGEGSHGEPEWNNKEGKYVYSDDWTIKAIKTVKGQTAYDYNASMADSKSDNGEIVLGEETLDLDAVAANASEATAKYAVDLYVANEYNETEIKKAEDVEEALNIRDGAQYKLMDWDSDGDIDWVVASTANYYKVEAVNSKRLTVSAMKAGNEETSTDSDSKTWKLNDLTEIDKVKYDFKTEEDLEEGDIIEVTYSVAYDKGEKDEVVTATITKVEADTAELDKVSTKDTLELTFDGEVKKIAEANVWGDVVVPANPKTYGDFDDEELGTEFALWTNRNGFIVYSDYATDSSNYLMVLDTGDGSDKTGDRKQAVMDVLYADNSVKKDVKVATDLKLDGYDKDSRKWDESEVVGNVYKYWMNEDGVITKMEALIDVDDAKMDDGYSYDQSADRLKDSDKNYVASLEDANVIFAVTEGYIQGNQWNLKVDAEDVIAVKQADIPDIAIDTNDTKTVKLLDTYQDQAWLSGKAQDAHFIADVDNNGEASAAILGVENFNKFNAASTTVGLVTSVSYDKNDVVEIEVAYKGEVTTVKSAEKVDFEDVVKQFNGTKDVDLTTKEAAKMLKDNAAYAEITTNADGQLTAVTFMNVNGNKATGHYYEVSRRIITNVKSGNVAYGDGSYYYYNNKNLYSVGRLPVDDVDLADTVYYYSIDGRPTTSDDKYDNVMMAVANGFDGTPDITAESDSNLINSYVNDKFDDADTYQVADLVTKIDGDIVAAYAFEDSLGEVDKAVSNLGDQTMKAGESKTLTVTAPAGQTVTAVKDVKVNGGSVNGITANAQSTNEIKIDLTREVAAGKYTVSYTYTIDGKDYNGSFVLTVEAADALVADALTLTDANGNAVSGIDNAAQQLFFKVTAKDTAVTDIDTSKVVVYRSAGQEVGYSVVKTLTPGVYQINLAKAAGTDKFTVQYAGKSIEGQAAASSVTVAAPSAITAFSKDAVKAKVTVAGAVPTTGWKVEVKDSSDNVIPATISEQDQEVTINPTGLTKSGSYTITVTAGSVSGTQTLTVNKETLTGTVSDVTTGAQTFKVTVNGYNDLTAEAKAEIDKINAATASGSAITSSQAVNSFTTNNDGTFNGQLSANPDSASDITITATVSGDYIQSLVFTGTVG